MYQKIKNRVRRARSESQLRELVEGGTSELTRLGTAESGWTIPKSEVKAGKIAICVGVGEDISFDLELNKLGLNVFTVDPTPRSKVHVEQILAGVNGGPRVPINRSTTEFYDLKGFRKDLFTYLDVGVWDQNTTMRFFAPKDADHVSHSIVNLQHTDAYFEAKCITLRDLCESQKIGHIDILKLDVEGAEYTILRNMLSAGPLPAVVCVEFDEIRNSLDDKFMPRIAEAVQMMKKAGYRFRHAEHSNALFEK